MVCRTDHARDAQGLPDQRQASLSAMPFASDGRPAFDLVSTQIGPTESQATATSGSG